MSSTRAQKKLRIMMMLVIVFGLSLAGCGNKGPLVQPEQQKELKKSQ